VVLRPARSLPAFATSIAACPRIPLDAVRDPPFGGSHESETARYRRENGPRGLVMKTAVIVPSELSLPTDVGPAQARSAARPLRIARSAAGASSDEV
jgi:hypothetical protein